MISNDLSLIKSNTSSLHLAVSDPVDFCAKMVRNSSANQALSRVTLAELSLACTIVGLRKNLEVNSKQVLLDMMHHEMPDESLVILELLYACRKLEALAETISGAIRRWSNDARIKDLNSRLLRLTGSEKFCLIPESREQSFGVLEFSYKGFSHFEQQFKSTGQYSINLGDYIQSEAVRRALIHLGIHHHNIHYVDRDDLGSYTGPELHLVMNGVFYPKSFPLSNRIKPLWFGFSSHPTNMLPGESKQDFINVFRNSPPRVVIGCRDEATAQELEQLGLATFDSGCLSQSLPADGQERSVLRTIACGVADAEIVAKLREADPETIVLPDQRRIVKQFPLSKQSMSQCRDAALSLLEFYQHHAGRVVTGLLHCAGPCAAMGIPTVVIRPDPQNIRFSTISHQLSVLGTNTEFDNISSLPFATLDLRQHQLDLLEAAIELNTITALETS